MKFWKKYKSYSLKKQRILFLLGSVLLVFVAVMWMPVSVEQTGLPDFTKETVTKISYGGWRPTISTEDPCFTDDALEEVWAAIPRLQSALEKATFYPRAVPISPAYWMSVHADWEIETESGTYKIISRADRLLIENNGKRSYYRLRKEADRHGKQRELWDELGWLSYYFIDTEKAYNHSMPQS
jgi:hypothetical protein